MFHPDLSNECPMDRGDHVRAVGWLGESHPFAVGPVSPEFLVALRAHVDSAWQPVVCAGPHFCDLCPEPRAGERSRKSRPGAAGNVWIPAADVVYVAPELIVHYIEAHQYRPPDEFVAAVLACPSQGSAEFHDRLRRFPRWWDEPEKPRNSW